MNTTVHNKQSFSLSLMLCILLTAPPALSHSLFPGEQFDTGQFPISVVIGDLNSDTIPDLVTANVDSNNVSVLLGNGAGTFRPTAAYPAGDGPRSIAIGDVNSDNRPDLVTANHYSKTVTVLLGNGDGTFQTATAFPVADRPWSVAIGDVNGDSAPDLVTANSYSTYSISVLLGKGDGTFWPATAYLAGGGPRSIAIGDVNNDNRPDLVTANYYGADHYSGKTVTVLLGNGDGTFQNASIFPAGDVRLPVAVVIGDLNGDNRPDLVSANEDSKNVSVLLGNGDGTFQNASIFPAGEWPKSVAIGDLNGDNRPDLVIANKESDNVVLLGNGDGTFQNPIPIPVGGGDYSVAIGDLNRDAFPDLVTANGDNDSVSVLLGNGDGTFQSATTFPAGGQPQSVESVAIGDLNDDTIPDLVTANGWASGNVSVLLGNGDGTFQNATTFPAGEWPKSVAIGDLNGDNRPDLVTANYDNDTVSVLFGNGDGTFQTATAFPVGDGPYSVSIGDLDGNNDLDLVTANYDIGNVSVLLGNGNGTFQTATAFPAYPATSGQFGGGPHSVAIGDLNGDTFPDLVTADGWRDDPFDTISVLLGNGNGTFRPATAYSAGDGQSVPVSVAIGDVNGDNRPDLVTANYYSGNVSVLLGNGDGAFQTATAFPAFPATRGHRVAGPTSVVIGNLNGDTFPDLVTANYDSGNVSVLLGNGNGTFQPATTFLVGDLIPYVVAIGDLNGDTFPDVVTANVGTNNVSVLLNKRKNTPAGNNVTVAPTDPSTDSTPVQLTFSEVTEAGNTSLTVSPAGPTLPTGFRLGTPPRYYDISTTASYSSSIMVCITYDPENYGNQDNLRLLHFENGAWSDVTVSNDTYDHIMCGEVSSLSPFVIGERLYIFRGFFEPVENLPVANVVKGGSAIPVRFSLQGNQGLNIFASGYPISVGISCTSLAPLVVNTIEGTATAGHSSLSYDPVTDQYNYVWKTDKTWSTTCRQLIVRLNDETDHTVYFKFK